MKKKTRGLGAELLVEFVQRGHFVQTGQMTYDPEEQAFFEGMDPKADVYVLFAAWLRVARIGDGYLSVEAALDAVESLVKAPLKGLPPPEAEHAEAMRELVTEGRPLTHWAAVMLLEGERHQN